MLVLNARTNCISLETDKAVKRENTGNQWNSTWNMQFGIWAHVTQMSPLVTSSVR